MRLRVTLVALALAVTACGPTTPSAVQCTVPTANPVVHTSLTAGEVWATGIHEVPSSLALHTANASLTIAPCTEVRLGDGASLEFTDGARLVAEGTQTNPIRFLRKNASLAWGHVAAFSAGSASLSYAALEGGGAAELAGASLGARFDGQVKVDHVTVTGSAGLGVAMMGSRFAAASTDLVVSGSGSYPLYIGADSLTTAPSGAYTGNAVDEVLLQSIDTAAYANDKPIYEAVVMHDLGVPYRVGKTSGDIRIGDGYADTTAGTLTIEAGVTVKFAPGHSGRILMSAALVNGTWQSRGALIIAGTADRPVTLTSGAANPAPGDWMGLYFANVVAPASRIDHLDISYAGGDSGTIGVCKASNSATNYDADCSIIFSLEGDLGTSQIVTNTRFSNGLGCGVYRGWHGTNVDFRPTNTFVGLAGCSQSNIPPQGQQTCDSSSCQ